MFGTVNLIEFRVRQAIGNDCGIILMALSRLGRSVYCGWGRSFSGILGGADRHRELTMHAFTTLSFSIGDDT